MQEIRKEITEIKALLDENRLDEALQQIDNYLVSAERSADLYYLKGQIHVKKQEWGKAINQFKQVQEIDAQYPGAQSQIDMVQAILGFFNPDLINP